MYVDKKKKASTPTKERTTATHKMKHLLQGRCHHLLAGP